MTEVQDLTDPELVELQADLEDALAEVEELPANPSDRTETVDLDQPIGRLSRMDAIQ